MSNVSEMNGFNQKNQMFHKISVQNRIVISENLLYQQVENFIYFFPIFLR